MRYFFLFVLPSVPLSAEFSSLTLAVGSESNSLAHKKEIQWQKAKKFAHKNVGICTLIGKHYFISRFVTSLSLFLIRWPDDC
jgi:hypothetical protein